MSCGVDGKRVDGTVAVLGVADYEAAAARSSIHGVFKVVEVLVLLFAGEAV